MNNFYTNELYNNTLKANPIKDTRPVRTQINEYLKAGKHFYEPRHNKPLEVIIDDLQHRYPANATKFTTDEVRSCLNFHIVRREAIIEAKRTGVVLSNEGLLAIVTEQLEKQKAEQPRDIQGFPWETTVGLRGINRELEAQSARIEMYCQDSVPDKQKAA